MKSSLLATIRRLALLVIAATIAAGTGLGQKAKIKSASDELFSDATLVSLQILITEKDIETLKKSHFAWGQQQEERAKVQVTVREGALVYTNVSLHLKGAAGSFRSIEDKPAFTLNFDKFADKQLFHGLGKLSLNNSVQDPTYASERMCRELFLKAGVPAPRSTHARVTLNDRELGLYVLTEGWDKDFLKRHFKKAKGNLYDGGFVKDITDELSLNAGGDPKDQSDRKALVDAANEPDLSKRLVRLEKVLDIDRFLSFIALDVMLWDWDGYAMNRNNYRLYHDLEKDKMVFLPHGLDQMFWKPDGSVLPPMGGLVANKLLEIPGQRARYFERMKQLKNSVFNVPAMTARVREISAKVSPVLAQVDAKELKEHEKAVTEFCEAMARRDRSLDLQLSAPIEPLGFNAAGLAALTGWQPRKDFGKPILSESKDSGPKGELQIKTGNGSSVGSWRTIVWLEKGKYKLSAKVKTTGLAADPGDSRGGAGLRVKSGRPENYLLGDSDWRLVEHEFRVQEPLTDVQLFCEFRGAEGTAWFDLDSLKLERLAAKP